MIVDKDLQTMATSNSLFNGVSKEQLKSYIKPKNFIQIKDGSIIYKNEDPADEVYLVIHGEVKIKCNDKKKIDYKYITDYFGEEGIENKQNRQSTAIANKDSILYKITSEELNNLVNGIAKVKENLSIDNSVIDQFDPNQFLIDENNVIPDDLTKTVNKEETYINFDEVEEDINL
jgi:signal-transduction protein with cAMP-binding, CBS, and nucleotidyltransferase domain